jgi:arsenite oxidase small subunit
MRRRIFLQTCAAAAFAATPKFTVAADAIRRNYSRARLVWPDGKPVRATTLPAHTNLVFHYPFAATPCFLLNLGRRLEAGASLRTADAQTYRWQGGVGPERSIVAYSAICAHKMSYPTRQISFISYRAEGWRGGKGSRVIHCCSEHSEYDPAQGAAVVGGPARQPLAAILLDYDERADELYAVGTLGGEMFNEFFSKFEFRLSLDFGGKAHLPAGDVCEVVELTKYCRQQVQC